MGIFWVLLAVFHVADLVYSENSCTVHIEKDADFVLFGKTTILNCTSNCTNLSWETRLTKLRVSTDKTVNFSWVEVIVNEWADSPIQCLATDDDKVEAKVIPYVLPSRLEIDLKEELEEDKEHEVTCSVYDVAPVQYVILSVIRGEETLFRRTYKENTSEGPQNFTEKFKFSPRRHDNLQDFACQVTLNLTNVPDTTMRSSPVTVRTYALPENPHITAEEWVEKGTVTTISCEVPNAFPQENIITMLSVDGFPNISATGNVFASISLNTSDLPAALYNLICESQVFSVSKKSDKRIYIYEHPMVDLKVSRRVANLSDTVIADCKLIQGKAEYFGLSISVDGEEVKKEESPQLAENITITRRKPNLSVTCEIFIQDNNKVLITKEETLNVYYPPEFSDSSCPDSIVWVEGEERMFGCRSEGNPTPEEECSFNYFSWQSSRSFIAERNMSGIYTCQASNPIGTRTKSVEVTVQYPPEHTIVVISATSSVSTGDPVTFSCQSEALPPPMYSWEIPRQAQVDFSQDNRIITIKEASSHHTGTYTCYSNNKHGNSYAQKKLEVKCDKTILMAVLLGIAGVAFLVVIGLVIYCFLQNGKKGFYDLLKLTPKNPNNSEIPLQEKDSALDC